MSVVEIERTSTGWQAELQATGPARILVAGFISFWLAGWATGEYFALKTMFSTLRPLLGGLSDSDPHLFIALPLLLFLLVWVTFWTFGGFMAVGWLLRLLFGRDRVVVGQDGLEIEHGYGLFRSRKRVLRGDVVRFYERRGGLFAETRSGAVEVTSGGDTSDRERLEAMLDEEFRIIRQTVPETSSDGELPKGWSECLSLEKDAILVKDLRGRRKRGKIVWGIGALVGIAAIVVCLYPQENLWVLVIILGVVTPLLMWAGISLSFASDEWRLEKGRLILQRRFGTNCKTRFEASTIELVETSSDENDGFRLLAVAAGAPPSAAGTIDKHRYVIESGVGAPDELRKFGHWLSQRCHLPFTNLTTPEAKALRLDELKEKLEKWGPFGRTAFRLIERMVSRRVK